MLRKALNIIKATCILLACVLIPLFIGIKFIKSSSEKDASKCVDTFLEDEGSGLSKYIGLQFENTNKDINLMLSDIKFNDLSDIKKTKSCIESLVSKNKTIAAVNIYEENGKFLVSSSSNSSEALDPAAEKMKNIDDKVIFSIDQLEDNSIVVKNIVKQEVNLAGKKNKYFFEFIVKWDQYETYMNGMKEGSFPRMFYIISPDCRRYVSLNSLPTNAKSKRSVVALGLHLVEKQQSISLGISNVKIETSEFTLYKDEIKIPEQMLGNKFYIIVATDGSTFKAVAKKMLENIPIIILILVASWLFLCLILSRFYNKTKDQLEISTKISESTPLAIAIFRVSDGKIMRINLSAMTLFRIDRESINTTNLWNLFIYDDDKQYIMNAASSNINVLNYEVLAQSFGGGSFWSICSASPINIEGELHIVLATLDINRRKEVEKKLANNAALLENQVAERTADLEMKAKELEESNLKLEKAKSIADEANAAKSKFLTNMSNELKTPINAIIGYSEILQEEALDRKDTVSADDLRKIIGSAKHLLSLINEILDLSKIEAGKTQLFFENIEVQTIIKDVEGITMPLITEHDNSFFLECAKDIGSMYTDATKLRQCLLNLLSNSAKFTEFGKVTLRVMPLVKGGVDFVEFSVIDTGIGISSDRLNNIFDPFQNNVSKKSGAGLGLSLTKKYTEYLGGTITVESESGVGSKFIMRIPRIAMNESNEFIEVKNRNTKDEEIIDEFLIDQEDKGSFGRKSDL